MLLQWLKVQHIDQEVVGLTPNKPKCMSSWQYPIKIHCLILTSIKLKTFNFGYIHKNFTIKKHINDHRKHPYHTKIYLDHRLQCNSRKYINNRWIWYSRSQPRNDLDQFAFESKHLTHSTRLIFILSATPFNCGIFGVGFWSFIPCSQQCASKDPQYSPPLSVGMHLSFFPVSLSTKTYIYLNTLNIWSCHGWAFMTDPLFSMFEPKVF